MDQLVFETEHHPESTKLLLEVFDEGKLPNIKEIKVEPVWGYFRRIVYKDGSVRITTGEDFGVNSSSCSSLSRDKGHTKFFLNSLGYCTPKGKTFLMPQYQEKLENMMLLRGTTCPKQGIDQAKEYVSTQIGFPCYTKPNLGFQGRGIFRCENHEDLESAIKFYVQTNEEVIVVEEAVNMPDYRVVIFDSEMISCYRRIPLTVCGDGVNSIKSLLDLKQTQFRDVGRTEVIHLDDPRMLNKLFRQGLTLESVLRKGTSLPLLDVSNLSMGGESEEYTHKIHPLWRDLCIAITKDMGLRLCGVDLACKNIESSEGEYSILEINAAPGLDNYASSGEEQRERVKDLYQRIFNNA